MCEKVVLEKYCLDGVDREILRILQIDNRTSHRELAKRMRLSPSAIQRRVAALEQYGVISANVAIVAPETLHAAISIMVEVHLSGIGTMIIDTAKDLFRSTPEIQQCYRLADNNSFMVFLIVPDMGRYNELSNNLFSDSSIITSFNPRVVLDIVKSGQNVYV